MPVDFLYIYVISSTVADSRAVARISQNFILCNCVTSDLTALYTIFIDKYAQQITQKTSPLMPGTDRPRYCNPSTNQPAIGAVKFPEPMHHPELPTQNQAHMLNQPSSAPPMHRPPSPPREFYPPQTPPAVPSATGPLHYGPGPAHFQTSPYPSPPPGLAIPLTPDRPPLLPLSAPQLPSNINAQPHQPSPLAPVNGPPPFSNGMGPSAVPQVYGDPGSQSTTPTTQIPYTAPPQTIYAPPPPMVAEQGRSITPSPSPADSPDGRYGQVAVTVSVSNEGPANQ